MQVNGFYELRLRFIGDDVPSNGVTFSQFRHVLDLEIEAEIFPDGFGPFDFMVAWTRFIVQYECIYERGCGLIKSADSFGGDARSIERLPRNLRPARRGQTSLGGFFENSLNPGTLVPVREELNPGRNPRNFLSIPGSFGNPNPLAGLLNLAPRGNLGRTSNPAALGTDDGGASRLIRAGSFSKALYGRLLSIAHPRLGNDRFRELRDEFIASGVTAKLQAAIPELLDTRPNDQFPEIGDSIAERLALQTSPELLTALFGAQAFTHNGFLPVLSTLNTPIRPFGYFTGGAVDILSEFDFIATSTAGVAFSFGTFDLATFPGGLEGGASLQRRLLEFGKGAIPIFLGPDGITNSPDDLPCIQCAGTSGLTLAPTVGRWTKVIGDDPALYAGVAFVDGTLDGRAGFEDTPLVLFGVRNPDELVLSACRAAFPGVGPRPLRLQNALIDENGECVHRFTGEQAAPRETLIVEQCASARGGINQDGDCIELNTQEGTTLGTSGLHFDLLDLMAERDFRPASAILEPMDLTGIGAFMQGGQTLPARPRLPDGGLNFQTQTAGMRRLLSEEHHLVSSLDLDFREDALRWGHGASDDENEFREGYLEFEMLDSQLTARLGKLIMVWGKTELFRNQDRLNPLDISNGVITRLEESRVGQWAAQVWIQPERWMRVGPVEDLRMELAVIFDDFEPFDLGSCGESGTLVLICLKTFGAYASGLAGIGLVGEIRPDDQYSGFKRMDYGIRVEGRWNRFTFSLSDFWGWDDGAVVDLVHQFGRRVDPITGAPVNATGPLQCSYRGPGGTATTDQSQAVGPDGIGGTNDDLIPSIGNCLLLDNPTSPNAAQTLRDSFEIVKNHSVNQTLFHTICTLTFDVDRGFCALDQLNDPAQFILFSLAFAGGGGGLANSAAFSGARTIALTEADLADPGTTLDDLRSTSGDFGGERFRNLPSQVSGDTLRDRLGKNTFKEVSVRGQRGVDFALDLTVGQLALLGCGPAFLTPCGGAQTAAGGTTFAPLNANPSDRSYLDLVGVKEIVQLGGGIDFQNADAGVLTQEFALLKAFSPGALIGTRAIGIGGPLRFEAGISAGSRNGDLDPLTAPGIISAEEASGLSLKGRVERTAQLLGDADPEVSLSARIENLEAFKRGGLEGIDQSLDQAPGLFFQPASDYQIEPFPWKVDEEALARGELIFMVADQTQRDPRCDARTPEHQANGFSAADIAACNRLLVARGRTANFTADTAASFLILNDPTDPTNPLNDFLVDFATADPNALLSNDPLAVIDAAKLVELDAISENCVPFMFDAAVTLMAKTTFGSGCTELENLSTNLERIFTAFEIVGGDSVFDPPESYTELLNMLDGDFRSDFRGDPISGPDGIFTLNFDAFQDADDQVDIFLMIDNGGVRLRDEPSIAPFVLPDLRDASQIEIFDTDMNGVVSPEEFFSTIDPSDCESSTGRCFLQIEERVFEANSRGGTNAPQALLAAVPASEPGRIVDTGEPLQIPLLEICVLQPDACASLLAGGTAVVSGTRPDPEAPPNPETGEQPQNEFEFEVQLISAGSTLSAAIDFDTDGQPDLDINKDGTYDGGDDFTPGPVSDDNILCGSGFPGDFLQNAQQFEPYRRQELEALQADFPDGFLRRSPVFCRSASALLGATGQTLPFKRAGGDGSFGRRDFLWHGGRQLALRYQKLNVLGFGLDFAEDFTKTSWGIEFSWTSDKLIGNTRTFSGLSDVDDMVLSISIDRPTFFNFVNPNRSFFLNFQFFMRYIRGFDGSSSDHDGNVGSAEGPFSGLVTFTFFTGYFQDRLAPRTTLVWDPTTNNGGILWGLSYRWSGNFTTSLSANHFFGHPAKVQRADFPAVLFGDNKLNGEALVRGLAAVRSEDSFALTVRYSW